MTTNEQILEAVEHADTAIYLAGKTRCAEVFPFMLKRLSEAAKECLELRGRSEWRPIETAPSDGTNIILWFEGQEDSIDYVLTGSWNDQFKKFIANSDHWSTVDLNYTHWKPIDTPPKEPT